MASMFEQHSPWAWVAFNLLVLVILAAAASSWAKAVAMKAETTRFPLFPAWVSTLRMKWTRQRCQVAFKTLEAAALSPHGRPR